MSKIRNVLIATAVSLSLAAAPSAFAFGQLKVAKGTSTAGGTDGTGTTDTTTQPSVVSTLRYMLLMVGL